MPGTLYVCAVPIGHDGDISHRVRDCLTTIPVIFCEDTRKTALLLKRLGIFLSQSLYRMDSHQESRSLVGFDRMISTGDVAYVTDAGAPGISDPGACLVAHARRASISIKILPGVSSLSAFISGCGVSFSSFYFGGFLPKKISSLRRVIDACIAEQQVGIWFESPRRILSLINDLNDRWPALHVVFAKELTKSHEAFFSGIVSEVHLLLNNTDLRGEWVFLLDSRRLVLDQDDHFQCIALAFKRAALSAKQVKALAPLFDCNKNDLYDYFQAL